MVSEALLEKNSFGLFLSSVTQVTVRLGTSPSHAHAHAHTHIHTLQDCVDE